MSERASNWGLRLLALSLALAAWFFMSLEKREAVSQRTVEASVTYNNPDVNQVILDPTQRIEVGVRGPASRVGNLNPFEVTVLVDLRKAEPGELNVPLSPEDIRLPSGLEVISIDPNLVRLTLDRVITQMMPIEPQLTGEPAAGAIYGLPEVTPAVALVRGPASELGEIEFLTTAPVSLDGHAIDFEEQALVLPPRASITVIQPALVTVKVPMQIPGATGQNESESG